MDELKNNDELFTACVDELDSWNGFADGFRAWDMCELDEFYCDCKVSKFLSDIVEGSFNLNDDWFYFSIYGLESTSDKVDLYRTNTDEGEVLDNLIDSNVNLRWIDEDFNDLLTAIQTYTEEGENDE